MKRRSVDRTAIAALPETILAELQAGPQNAEALAVKLGVAGSTVRARLSQMILDGVAHRVTDCSSGTLGSRHTYYLGAGEPTGQRAATTYPSVGRHWMDVALFGPAGKVVA